ncbi:MAG: UvrB/UvrC motif-containing protein [Phycisphaerales bacterium]|nr:UvrB/UvrC motif-containing protein [Phycisphaerales bacterium]
MERDLTEMLEEWPFEPGKISVRVIEGKDGDPRIQVRLDLGLLQMYVAGRPDGKRPEGYDSLLDYHESHIDQMQMEEIQPPEAGAEATPEGFTPDEEEDEETIPRFLTQEECKALREEAQQYYHRYIALLVLEDYEAVVRDTSRNLRVLDLFRDYALEEEDQHAMEGHRPYIMMMRARSLASLAMKAEENKAAIFAIDEGLESLKKYYEGVERPELFEESGEVQMLRDMRDALVPKLPVSQKAELRQRLDAAIASENFELAAILRDEIRMLGGDAS